MNSGLTDVNLEAEKPRPRFALWGYIAVLLICAIPFFGHLDEAPIVLFDEQRLATNALEMNASGDLIVTTYDGKPDYSNTKPPLMIWLQAVSMRVLGENEMAVRLPSALAALATCLLLYSFCIGKFGSPLLGLCAATILCSTQGYTDIHGVRTGDYDGLLTFFTTAYCLAWFSYIEERRTSQLYFFFAALLLAVLAKCTEACIMLPALAIYTIAGRQTGIVLRNRHFYFGMLVLVVPVAAYYAIRQHLDPGYLDAVWKMDIGGRYGEALSRAQSPNYYVMMLLTGTNMVPWLFAGLAGAAAGAASGKGPLRRLSLFLLLVIAVFIGVLSFSATKFYWYLLPAYPLLALLAAVCFYQLFSALNAVADIKAARFAIPACAFLALLAPYWMALDRATELRLPESMQENMTMGFFMKDVLHGRRRLDNCAVAIESYEGNIRWYFRALAKQGRPVRTIEDRHFEAGQKVAAYQYGLREFIETNYDTRLLEDFRGVHVYQILGPKKS